ncbi:16S rRNA (cytosine(967)-C(5))-methyltransferase RsmB [Marininema halotolerans]|uniref:16S rRNA (cytosine(967)-C(5))-methyltransferase n=1 Tax=Marininema halotolerans TaxID=1155944 RepID=A0A1I6QET9_9BACL|nr:16S rRNA (cytosine(967)-C(5))-methyltransferase RsmB [Marininema halotolerans]SFS51009.1 16S rRNA (cytosine967-C5)-methyltransferase [Marininema halotolerans]
MGRQQKTAREVALDILIDTEERGAYSNLLLNDRLKKSKLTDTRDRGLVTELVYGTIQRRNTLDWVLNTLVKKGVSSIEPWVRQLLRMGIYQLRYLDRIPSRAAVHETVDQAKSRGHKGIAGLVNGVMRGYLRREREWDLPSSTQDIRQLALLYSHPEWMVRRWVEVYGVETTTALLAANNEPPTISLRFNPLKTDRQSLIHFLQEEYPEAEVTPSTIASQGVIFRGGGNPALHSRYREGWYSIQDESSMIVSEVVDPQPGERGLDGCAAPGGKTTHLAERMKNEGAILSCDIHGHKVALIRENLDRLGLTMVETKEMDLRELPDKVEHPFDFVLLDAPCSGLGVIRRKPDIKWSKEVSEIEGLIQLQAELLDAAANLVAPNGVLVYSTCTIEPRENEEQVRAFLARNESFQLDDHIEERLSTPVKNQALIQKGRLQILPHHFHSDGFFITRMVRKEK